MCESELARSVFRDDHDFDKGGPIVDLIKEVAGHRSMVVMDHDEHRTRRRMVQPAFCRVTIDDHGGGGVPQRFTGRAHSQGLGRFPRPLNMPVRDGLFLAAEVVAERATRHPDALDDVVHANIRQAAFPGQQHCDQAQLLAQLLLLALPQSALHASTVTKLAQCANLPTAQRDAPASGFSRRLPGPRRVVPVIAGEMHATRRSVTRPCSRQLAEVAVELLDGGLGPAGAGACSECGFSSRRRCGPRTAGRGPGPLRPRAGRGLAGAGRRGQGSSSAG
jgi:hypothetical protein